jgi:hypothetical protein
LPSLYSSGGGGFRQYMHCKQFARHSAFPKLVTLLFLAKEAKE